MRRTTIVAGSAALGAGLLGLIWFALYLAQPILGFEDTDDPALGVEFVRAHPEVFTATGTALILMAIVLVIAVVSVAATARQERGSWAVRSASAFGLFAALCFLVFGAMRIGAVGPLLHIASLDAAWGEAAYLVVQMAGVQGVLPAGLLALAVWAAGLSLIGIRSRLIPPGRLRVRDPPGDPCRREAGRRPGRWRSDPAEPGARRADGWRRRSPASPSRA